MPYSENDEKSNLELSEKEMLYIYTALSALPNLPEEYWRLKEKIGKHMQKKLTIDDLLKIRESIQSLFPDVHKKEQLKVSQEEKQ